MTVGNPVLPSLASSQQEKDFSTEVQGLAAMTISYML